MIGISCPWKVAQGVSLILQLVMVILDQLAWSMSEVTAWSNQKWEQWCNVWPETLLTSDISLSPLLIYSLEIFQITWKHELNHSVFHYLEKAWSEMSGPLLSRELPLVEVPLWCYHPSINTLGNHVTLGKMGWTPNYSLHPIQWNFSSMDGVEPCLVPVRLRIFKSGRSGHCEHFAIVSLITSGGPPPE